MWCWMLLLLLLLFTVTLFNHQHYQFNSVRSVVWILLYQSADNRNVNMKWHYTTRTLELTPTFDFMSAYNSFTATQFINSIYLYIVFFYRPAFVVIVVSSPTECFSIKCSHLHASNRLCYRRWTRNFRVKIILRLLFVAKQQKECFIKEKHIQSIRYLYCFFFFKKTFSTFDTIKMH